jgi:hypothetical protein
VHLSETSILDQQGGLVVLAREGDGVDEVEPKALLSQQEPVHVAAKVERPGGLIVAVAVVLEASPGQSEMEDPKGKGGAGDALVNKS